MLKEMVYNILRKPPERIADGTYKGLDYYVLSLGTHPTAYIDVSDTKLAGKDYNDIDIECHGGLTYGRNRLLTVDKKGWFIGWDYGHCGDYRGDCRFTMGNKRWTTEEIVEECKSVIEQINEMLGSGKSNG